MAGVNQEVAVRDKTKSVRQLLAASKTEIAAALPKHVTAERMARVVMTEVQKNPQLLECDSKSLMGSVIQASQLGLEPGGALGHCYLVPFNNRKKGHKECQFIVGYRGMIELANRAGVPVIARAVYDGDTFNYEYGMEEKLKHVPCGETDPEKLTHVYAIGTTPAGMKLFVVLNLKQILASRDSSAGANRSDSPWKTDFVAMAMKTAIRQLFKFLPSSIEIQKAAGLDEQAERGISQGNDAFFVDSEVADSPTQKSSIENRLAKAEESEFENFDKKKD